MAHRDSMEGHWLSKSGVKRGIRDRFWLVSDVLSKALALSVPRRILSRNFSDPPRCRTRGRLTRSRGLQRNLVFGPEIMDEPCDIRKRDYPVMSWLSRSLAEGCRILNLGGSAGTEYFTCRQFLQFPERVFWMVCELPQVVEFGRSLANAVDAPGLAFTTRIEDGAGADIFVSCGALQYLEQDLAMCLRGLQPRPLRVLVNRIPLYDGETFFTIQSSSGSAVPYRVQNRQELVNSMIELDYQLVDCWSEKREVIIPSHPQRSVDESMGSTLH